MRDNPIIALLTEEYIIELATTSSQLEDVKKVRKQILLPKYHTRGEIKDTERFFFNEDDAQAFIYLLKHRQSNTYVGTVRVYFINDRTPQQFLPMEHYTHAKSLKTYSRRLPVCEISRLALARELPKHNTFSPRHLRTLLTLGLMATTRINLFLYPYTYVFSLMESSLDRLLRRQKVNFEQIGDYVECYGKRAPFVIERKKLLAETEETMGEITRFYLRELCKSPEAFWRFIDAHPYLDRSDIVLDRLCQKEGYASLSSLG
jgi:N-acyl amino acid synthase of PEP-CTERM/exosortase system